MKHPQELFNLVMMQAMRDLGQSDKDLLAVIERVADNEWLAQERAYLDTKADFGPFMQA